MRNLILIFLHLYVTISCTNAPTPIKPARELYSLSDFQPKVEKLSKDQQAAFDALNTLQVNTDKKDQLYSTFPNTEHPCYPPDSTFEISNTELQTVMQKYIARHCKNLEPSLQMQLTQTSVLAQKSYIVFYCKGEEQNSKQESKFPMIGTWILPSILGRRDLLLHW